jgi:dTDP-glucose 4,6-dehydratase
MRVMVTGGAGFIGSAVCRHLVGARGATVLNIDKLTYASNLASLGEIAQHQRHSFCRADICDHTAIEAAFRIFQPNAVVHLAAESHVDRSITDAGGFVATNVTGTYTLLEAARSYWKSLRAGGGDDFRFLHVSTDEVFGSLDNEGSFTEESAYAPSSPYSASKAAADHLVAAWHRTYGLPTMICNCSNTYGPYQYPEKLIPLMILNARDGKQLPLYGDGLQIRDWLYVEDLVRALCAVLMRGRPGERYNVGGRNEQTNFAVVRRICALMDERRPDNAPHERLITRVADRPGHDRRYAIDATKLTTAFGWRAEQDFAGGMATTVDWYLDHPGWWQERAAPGRGPMDELSTSGDQARSA